MLKLMRRKWQTLSPLRPQKASSVCTIDHHHVLSFHSMNIEPSFALAEPIILYASVSASMLKVLCLCFPIK